MHRLAKSATLFGSALTFATLACSTLSQASIPATLPPAPTYTPYPTFTPYPTQGQEAVPDSQATPSPSQAGASTCSDPRDVTADDKGKVIEVCGRIIDEGTQDCPDCPYGVLDYVTFEGGFNVISYYWNFYSYEGLCLRAKDTVELMGSRPVFVYGAREGFSGSQCSANNDGSLNCDGGDYFLYYEGCN